MHYLYVLTLFYFQVNFKYPTITSSINFLNLKKQTATVQYLNPILVTDVVPKSIYHILLSFHERVYI